jgi:hypothetical protein
MVRSDFGVPRKRYDMSLRGERKRLADLKRTQEDIERYEKLEKKRAQEPVGRTRAERKRDQREAALPADRTCPTCGKVKLKSRQWVILGNIVQCKSCFMKGA